ncbi:putative peptidoglycan glycosyltransferase FtsW [Catellatospora sp. KI3]|uniref:FtsW/RodA/SpoVE family cell cycle protein n=1 Tax=Catellatospora sp. KI3 TaxID=3041620 RepID=UPI002482CE96|nr:putative peptidoglycan glycosyltransferase FtsW [Catellatospora sp. KI3]MDI1464864.1 putative peptidoglycan glycosyltransferase FtsW [Catellatospora sp. KI3]
MTGDARTATAPPPAETAASAPDPRTPRLDPFAWIFALRGLLARPLASYYLLLASAGLLLVIGLAMVFSATSVKAYNTSGNAYAVIAQQIGAAVVGLAAFWVCQRLPRRTFRAIAKISLTVSLVLLVIMDGIALLYAAKALPAPRIGFIHSETLWLYLGPVQLQPSELAKFALVLWGADVLTRKGKSIVNPRELLTPLFPVVGLLFVLVGYTDLGTMLCLLILFIGLLWAAGVPMRFFGMLIGAGLGGIALLIMAPVGGGYRSGRFGAFFQSDADIIACYARDESCYQAKQGLLAIADGGWFGVGLGKSSLKWNWLPSAHNDFIFAVIAEELGVVGCLVVLSLFAVLTYTGLRIARRVQDPFRRMAACAVTLWLVSQAVINIGGVVKLLPITGLPLPFISDGGTALVVTLAAVGMLASFARAEPDAARALHARPAPKWVQLVWAPLPALPAPARPADAAAAEPAAKGGPEPKAKEPAARRGGPTERRR